MLNVIKRNFKSPLDTFWLCPHDVPFSDLLFSNVRDKRSGQIEVLITHLDRNEKSKILKVLLKTK